MTVCSATSKSNTTPRRGVERGAGDVDLFFLRSHNSGISPPPCWEAWARATRASCLSGKQTRPAPPAACTRQAGSSSAGHATCWPATSAPHLPSASAAAAVAHGSVDLHTRAARLSMLLARAGPRLGGGSGRQLQAHRRATHPYPRVWRSLTSRVRAGIASGAHLRACRRTGAQAVRCRLCAPLGCCNPSCCVRGCTAAVGLTVAAMAIAAAPLLSSLQALGPSRRCRAAGTASIRLADGPVTP